MHHPADVILVIVNAEALFDRPRQPAGSPAIYWKSVQERAVAVNFDDLVQLFGRETARTATGPPFPQRLEALAG